MTETLDAQAVFRERANWLHQHILPSTQRMTDELIRDFPKITISLASTHREYIEDKDIYDVHKAHYTIRLSGRLSDKVYDDYNAIELSVSLQLSRLVTLYPYPRLSADVSWLIHYESDGTWGLDPVDVVLDHNTEARADALTLLEKELPRLYRSLRQAIENPPRS